MDALLTAFVAAALGEWGDKTQLLVVLLAARFRRPGAILAGVAVAAVAGSLIAAFAGTLIHGTITPRAASVFLALALAFAGAVGLIGSEPNPRVRWPTGPFLTAAGAVFLSQWGDKTPFVTAAVAAQFGSLAFPAAGAAAGMILACVPAALLGDRLPRTVPLKGVRIGVGLLFLLAAAIVAVNALRLV